ncbi:MAG: guanylate kinase [Methylococcaceae bacterium]|nr:guanylate kinase [Methylococcaceae bacterium]
MNKGKLYIISAPSGAGKTSLVKQLVSDLEQLIVSVSHTTREMRVGEEHGKDYFFSTVIEFKKMIAEHAFLEHAQVFDNFYGTSQQSVEYYLDNGIDVILEIDWQGAQQVRKMLPDSLSIFILPPSIEVLQQRLENRGQDSKEIIERRMQDAVKEMSHCDEFNYLIVNDDFNQALAELRGIVVSHRLEQPRQLKNLASLLEKLITPGDH